MKKKSLFAIGLTLSMVMAMATPAFAANTATNVNNDVEITTPGDPDYNTTTKIQQPGQSYNEATMTYENSRWETVNDDDNAPRAADPTTDINVWARVLDQTGKIYKVDFAWGAMTFEYQNLKGTWDPVNHKYTDLTSRLGWTQTVFLEGVNNKVVVTNHSNGAINAAFEYKMDNTLKFNNDSVGVNAVIGNFFDTNSKAQDAAKVLEGTYANGNPSSNVLNKLTTPVVLATAEAYNNGTPHTAGPRTDDVFFAFSGSPDPGKSAELPSFKKVGVITVTVTPNNTPNLNS